MNFILKRLEKRKGELERKLLRLTKTEESLRRRALTIERKLSRQQLIGEDQTRKVRDTQFHEGMTEEEQLDTSSRFKGISQLPNRVRLNSRTVFSWSYKRMS